MISLSDMSQRLVGQRVAELGACRDQLIEPVPLRRIGDRHFQRHTIVAGLKQRGAQCGEGADRIGERCLGTGNRLVMQPLRLSPGLPDDPVMGFDDSIGNRRFPLHYANSKDRPAPVRSDVTQAVGEVAFTLPAQACDTVGWRAGENLMIEIQITQKLQSVEQAVCGSRVVADLEIAKPNEAADVACQHLGQKPIQLLTRVSIQLFRDPRFDSAFGGDQGIRAQALDCRHGRQNSRSLPASRNKTLGKILVRSGIFSLIEEPVPQITGATA
ncbi:hypothetical protein M527_27645 [Sphingobium indicum IP26]|uniref:Uncharacterized protein n=1 Tax=Sphingobium indicum F2 TaxID=1450518 RepID=A0A8E1C127_9SPHN|nr:hypothetical protein M527_27645 [Sphingobium indicum IP26]KER34747.1 hypothetical protein AL00_19485 [Sphingobium indicum F2]